MPWLLPDSPGFGCFGRLSSILLSLAVFGNRPVSVFAIVSVIHWLLAHCRAFVSFLCHLSIGRTNDTRIYFISLHHAALPTLALVREFAVSEKEIRQW